MDLRRSKKGKRRKNGANISTEFLESMKNEQPGRLHSCQCYNNAPISIRNYVNKILQCDLFQKSVKYLPRDFNAQCY